MDEVDIQILRLLQQDGRITNADLSKRVDLSPPSVLQRVRALEKAMIDYYGSSVHKLKREKAA